MPRRRPYIARLRLPRPLARFSKSQSGATAVEFALVALPFFALLFAIMQTSLVMFANQALQTMTSKASRQIMTGEIAAAKTGLAGFKSELCRNNGFMFDCDKLMVQVQSFASFATANPQTFINQDCFRLDPAPPASCWNPGGPRNVVLVRVAYEWPFGIDLEHLNRKSLLVAVSAFRSEPYQ